MQTVIDRLKALFELLRFELPVSAGICVIAGELFALGSVPSLSEMLLGFMVGFFLSGAAMASNDYFDLEVDRVNHPERPLPSGRVTVPALFSFTILLAAIGLLAAFILGPISLIVAIVIMTIGQLYNWRIKETGILGNMTVSISVASTFIFGGVAVGEISSGLVWTFGIMAFIFDLGEEIASGAMDLQGDEKRSTRSLARMRGREHAVNVAVVLFSLFMMLGFVPFFAGWVGLIYICLLIPTDIATLFFVIGLIKARDIKTGRNMLRGLYLTITVFVLLFVVSRLL